MVARGDKPICWCGNTKKFRKFNNDYVECKSCGCLVSINSLSEAELIVRDDENDFYGKKYWLDHQENDLNFPNIYQRARDDLFNRNIYWLKTLLKYKLPPGKILEIGAGPGGFVGIMNLAGYDATGIELSPWVVEFAKKNFDVPMFVGPVDDLPFKEASLDGIVLLDVIEHLSSPDQTLMHCAKLLKREGIFLIQTPNYNIGSKYTEMVKTEDIFLEQLKSDEHLYLFNRSAIEDLFSNLGFHEIIYEKPKFPYDMFFIASRESIQSYDNTERDRALSQKPGGRFALALIDLFDKSAMFETAASERMEVIEVLQTEINRLQSMRK